MINKDNLEKNKKPKSKRIDYIFNVLYQINRYCLYSFFYLIIRQSINRGFNEDGQFMFDLWFKFASVFIFSTLILRVIGYKMVYKEEYTLIIALFLVTAAFFEIFGTY